jgi:hypothetical protein
MRSIARVRAAPILLLKRRELELEIPTSIRVSFSLVPFFWTSKRKILAVGQPPTRLSGRNRTLDSVLLAVSFYFIEVLSKIGITFYIGNKML